MTPTPQRDDICICSRGYVGVVVRDGMEMVTYPDGNKAMAYVGYHLSAPVGAKWSSRHPTILGQAPGLASFIELVTTNEKSDSMTLNCQHQLHGVCPSCRSKLFSPNTANRISRPSDGKVFVYVAGPYTKPDPCQNTNAIIHIANLLVEKDFVPFVPHLSLLWHTVTPQPYEYWMTYDLNWLERCDVLLRVPGESFGADREVAHAEALGIPVFYGIDALVEWRNNLGVARIAG